MVMKNQLDAVHPELRSFAGRMPRLTFNAKTLRLWRLLNSFQVIRKRPQGVDVENITIPRQDGESRLRLRLYLPKDKLQAGAAMLWLHGGGYIIGKPEQDDASCAQLARESGILIASLDYRLAPEHAFPCALEDISFGWMWLCSHAGRLGVDVSRLAVGGASAGGGLAAAFVQLSHDRNELQPVFQLLVYPMLDDRTCARSDLGELPGLAWSQESNRFGWESYLGAAFGTSGVPEYASPSRRTDLSGLPPAWIGVGTLDLFHDECVAYAQCLINAGVACQSVIIPGAFHGFDLAGLKLRVVQEFRQSQVAALKQYLVPGNG
jgi:acetyl esterase/lipase